jgi:cysteine desulfurase family protein (TIGR01976 family)
MFDVARLREQFPALSLKRNGRTPIFLDGPAGTQVPRSVVEAVSDCLIRTNANHGGLFAVSRAADAMLDRAHQAVAEFLGAGSPDEIVFGQNMTTLTFALSRAVGKTWKPGDEVMVTRSDHDANVSPWLLAARDAGAIVRWIDLDPESCTLDLDSFRRQLSDRTKLVAVGLASNLVGTIHPVATIAREAKRAGALTFVDAVHFGPHGPIDVKALGCDFLACSAYKFFGPHVGILWGRRELLDSLAAYKVRPAPDAPPGKWMTGTQNHEGIAGTLAAVEYLNSVGMSAIREYEKTLARRLLDGLASRPRFRIHGLGSDRLDERVPTIAITDRHRTPRQIAEHLAEREIYVWSGNSYALELSTRIGREPEGIVRLGLVHYNTTAEVDALLEVLDRLPA